MFSKKNLVDIKKSTAKLQDSKKDVQTRIKHLKLILDNVDTAEAKGFFEANFSHIYNILYESFVQMETNLRQRELSFHLVHKAHKEELDCTLWILEQVLSLLPELINRRWQIHSLGRLLAKLLHQGNSIKLRRQGVKYFLMWYQALNENAPEYVHKMFASLVPGFHNHLITSAQAANNSIFHDAQHPVNVPEMQPILPPSSGEKAPEHPNRFYLEILLDNLVTTVIKLEWQDKSAHYHRCFNFLLEQFKIYYLPKICPDFQKETSLYRPRLELPLLRKMETETEFVFCRVSLILWITNYMHNNINNNNNNRLINQQQNHVQHQDDESADSAHPSLDSYLSIPLKSRDDEELPKQIVRDVLTSSRENVNFIHEIYRQAFLLNFNHVVAIRKLIMLYKDLIQQNANVEFPSYALEPPEEPQNATKDLDGRSAARLRNDSYLGAIQRETPHIRAGMQNVYQLFMTHAANVFLLEVNPQIPRLLEEQTDACKRVLNIYRFMVMNVRMDSNTWEQLLLVLLQITASVLGSEMAAAPKKKSLNLGGKLAAAIFQTLIVTWIKANLNVAISRELWDRFLHVLTSLTNWEELIKEWAKTMETLTRVLARHVYNLDLTNLPLDQKQHPKRSRRLNIRSENHSAVICQINPHPQQVATRQDSTMTICAASKHAKTNLLRSFSETNLLTMATNKKIRRKSSTQQQLSKKRRAKSLEHIALIDGTECDQRSTRSPSPAPSSGMENSIKDSSPLMQQLDTMIEHNNLNQSAEENETNQQFRGVVCGGTIRGWLPDVAVILWKRMLCALGDVNAIRCAKLHAQVYDYLIKLTDSLLKIKRNQGLSSLENNSNVATPHAAPPELIPPLTLILPWCFGAQRVRNANKFQAGKLNALRLLITIILNCDSTSSSNVTCQLSLFYYFLHTALNDEDERTAKSRHTAIKYLGGSRFFALQMAGSSILLLDILDSCNFLLTTAAEKVGAEPEAEEVPKMAAISILVNLLSLPDDLSRISVLKPELELQIMEKCPNLKEYIVDILLRTGKMEKDDLRARCLALSGLGMFIYKELLNQTFSTKLIDAINVLLGALKVKNKMVVQLTSDILLFLCDHANLLWSHYPRLGNAILSELCASALLSSRQQDVMNNGNDRSLTNSLLLCLGEWCMKLGPKKLLEPNDYGEIRGSSLLLQVFSVLHRIIIGNHGNIAMETADVAMATGPVAMTTPPIIEKKPKQSEFQRAVKLCAETVLAHLINHLGHFPMAIGAARLSSLVSEHDDVPDLLTTFEDLPSSNNVIFSVPTIQLFILTKNVIASLIELPALDSPGGGATADLVTADKQVRVLLRDMSGKNSWDASILYRTPENAVEIQQTHAVDEIDELCNNTVNNEPESFVAPLVLPQRAMRHRPPNVLPEITNFAPDFDQLDDLLQYLGHTSPECLKAPSIRLNEPAPAPFSSDLEQEIIASVIQQRSTELEEAKLMQQSNSRSNTQQGASCKRPTQLDRDEAQSKFQQCRLLFSQLGLTGWEKRNEVQLLDKNDRLLRELRNLDNQSCRETHKFAVIYVAPGQEDKTSILSNQSGSLAYEEFLTQLAWEIELEYHTGFLGGLQKQGSNGLTAPYVATSFMEEIFHVATRMPGDSSEAVLNKTRHLGNDEVHIVWSEHSRDYRRDLIPTEFCDILIVIYPLGNNLNRITIDCKADVPYFGILFNEAIIESNILAGLVRSTAICASRAKRITYQFYQQYYEERARSLETVITKHKLSTTFEEFISKVYSPMPMVSPFLFGGAATTRSSSNSCSENGGGASSTNSSMLAAALLDSSTHSQKIGRVDQKFRASANEFSLKQTVWVNQGESNESDLSPKELKKRKTTRKIPKNDTNNTVTYYSPPESPFLPYKKKL